jgi:hypothetical protein
MVLFINKEQHAGRRRVGGSGRSRSRWRFCVCCCCCCCCCWETMFSLRFTSLTSLTQLVSLTFTGNGAIDDAASYSIPGCIVLYCIVSAFSHERIQFVIVATYSGFQIVFVFCSFHQFSLASLALLLLLFFCLHVFVWKLKCVFRATLDVNNDATV